MYRSLALVSLLALVAVACGSGAASPPSPEGKTEDGATPVSSPGSSREPIRASSEGCEPGEFHWDQASCEPAHSIPLDEILSGGPPPDGIPPIDDPVFETVEDADDWLGPTSPVMVVDVDDDVRAYPLAILTWHEIVNDTVGGVPLVVTYCPLCNSALVFERTVEVDGDAQVLDFGTSGRLYLSNLVMYDRQHNNLWTQFEGEAVVGEPLLGTRLTRLPAWLFGFEELVELHPDAQVLSRDTGYNRDYGRNPYSGYDNVDNSPFLFRDEVDERFPAMTRFVGVADGDSAAAIALERLNDERTIHVDLDDREVVAVWSPGQASALDTSDIDQGRDVGQTAVFDTDLGGETVELAPTDEDGVFRDTHSGSRFDLRGRALDGPLEGQQLTAVAHDDTFWFVWVAFRPDTQVIGP